MAVKNKKKTIIVSPLEFRHFILDIPKVSEKYQRQAVSFALKSCYPGSSETTSVDYAYKAANVIGIAADSKKLEETTAEYNYLVSPTLVVLNSFDDGIFLCCIDKCLEIQIILAGKPVIINTFSSDNIDVVMERVKDIRNNTDFNELDLYLVKGNCRTDVIETELKSIQFFYQTIIFDDLLKKSGNKSMIFLQNKNKPDVFAVLLMILIVVFSFFLVLSIIKDRDYKNSLHDIKKEYTELKASISQENISSSSENDLDINKIHSLHEIYSEIANTSASIKILSFTYTGDGFRFEAEDPKALQIVEKLKQTSFFYGINLIQSSPKEDGSEIFTITGRIK